MDVEALETRVRALENLVAAQTQKLQKLDDIESIKKLQKAYGYYVEHMMYDEIVDCFADSPEVVLNWLEGQWLGKDGVKRYFNFMKNTPLNFQHQVMQIAGIVDIDPDDLHARGRWYAFGGIFLPRKDGVMRGFVSGIYEMGYIKENGIWKILSIKWIIPYSCQISEKWKFPEEINLPYYTGQFQGPKPDIPVDKSDLRYVSGYIFPFHYKHPVTGKETSENERNIRLKPVATP